MSARKAYVRQMGSWSEVFALERPTKTPRKEFVVITFSEEDEMGVSLTHNDALVITLTVANHVVHRILVDNGSSTDVLYWPMLQQMKINRDMMKLIHTPLVGFARERVQRMGVVTLPVTTGTSPRQAIVMTDFLIVDWPSAYNTIIGRPTLNKLRAITSTHHLKMKIPTDNGVGEVKGDQLVARKCYYTSLKAPINKETLSVGIDF
jgi:hypothetical protein